MNSFELIPHICKAFISIERCNLGVTSRKVPAFLQGLFSSSSVGAGDEDRTRDPLLGN